MLHNLADPVRASQFGAAAPSGTFCISREYFAADGALVVAAYPLVPWFAVMALGFCFGGVVTLEPARRRWWMLRIGLGLTLAFLVIRGNQHLRRSQSLVHKNTGHDSALVFALHQISAVPRFSANDAGPALLLMAWLDRLHTY